MIKILQKGSKYLIFPAKAKDAFHEVAIEELGDRLRQIKGKDVVILGMFPSFLTDLVVTPKLPGQWEKDMLKKELKRRIPEINDPVFVYHLISERVVDGRPQNTYFLAVLEHSDLAPVLGQVLKAKKECRFISSLPLVLGSLLGGNIGNEVSILVCDLGPQKLHVLYMEKKVAFIRVSPSDGDGFSGEDLENLSQTLAYFRETLRISPELLYYTTSPGEIPQGFKGLKVNRLEIPTSPMGTLSMLRYGLEKIVEEPKKFQGLNFIPDTYKILKTKGFIASAIRLILLVLVLSVIGIAGLKADNIILERRQLKALESELTSAKPVIEEYNKLRSELERLRPSIQFHNQILENYDLADIIDKVRTILGPDIQILQITFKIDSLKLYLTLKGKLNISSNAEAYVLFTNIVKSLTSLENLKLEKKDLDIKTKNFELLLARNR